ncbi:MAG: TIGR01459 family HAD-type hydrolase, partial [Rhodobacter sp.]|nr:TIGR01459 family HAD-type hydrolase [Rhodobacter sp.]
MTRILSALAQVSDRYDALYCDLWGCLHDGRHPFPDAVAALRTFRAKGGSVLLLTNAPRPRPSVQAQLDQLGVPRDCYDEIVSSGDAAQYALITGAVGR